MFSVLRSGLRIGTIVTMVLCCFAVLPISAAPVYWTDWISGTSGTNGSAYGTINIPGNTVDVNYSGEIAFIQTSSTSNNYWTYPETYTSALVDNAPSAGDIIALNHTTSKTLSFSRPVQDLFLAFVSLNGNGYRFDQDFEIVSTGRGYWGTGTVVKNDLGEGIYELQATGGEPHGVVRFTGPVSSLFWTCNINEHWHGFTVGTYGVVPEPGSFVALGSGLLGLLGCAIRRRIS